MFSEKVGKFSSFAAALTVMWAAIACSGDKKEGGEAGDATANKYDRTGWPTELKISAIPDVQPAEMLTQYEPIAAYLSKELGIPVKFTPVGTAYEPTVEGLAQGQLHLVWYGGYTSVQADKATGGNIDRLVMREEDKKFKSVFIAPVNSGIKTLKDLKGKSFTFGSSSSTSGHLMPRYFLIKDGIDPMKDFKGPPAFSGNHDNTIVAVQGGTVQAGALNYIVWDKSVANGKADTTKVKVFYTTPEYVDYCWTVRGDMAPTLKEAIKNAFLKLDYSKPADSAFMSLQKTKKYTTANNADWKQIEEVATAAGMLK
jgi:phosphonate transport system substrate-binding protein